LKTSDKATQNQLLPGNHFGHASVGQRKELHKHDIIARSEVSCVVILHEHAPYLSPASTWRHQPGELSVVERLLQLEFIKDDMFKAHSMLETPSFWGNMYGGRMVGLALGAASKTVDPALVVHSLHSYFVLSGNPSLPIFFKVERIRSGRTFATRHVQATQKGKVCFVLYASFQRAEDGLEHQYPMPDTPSPNELPTYEELLGPLCNDTHLPEYIRLPAIACLKMSETLDLRYFRPRSRLTLEPQEPRQRLWVRTNGKLGDDEALHRCAAGYLSDWSFLETAMMPHTMVVNKHPIVGFSIDHS
jgi:acyl-coenzyme A thioesterase 1/2/4